MLHFAAKCVSRLTPRIAEPVRAFWRITPPQKAFTASLTLDAKPTLRDYQKDCINSVLSSIEAGHKRVGISLATGSGKTVIFTQLIDMVQARSDSGGDRTLILAHRRELVEQAARHCQLAYPDKTIEIEMGTIRASGAADITVASVQSITSKDRLEKYSPRDFKLVLVDEAHHIVAPGYLKTLNHFGLGQKQQDSPTLVGVSATFSRFDGVKLGAAIDEIVYHRDYVDMITDKWLSDVVFTTVESSANLSKVKKGAFGDFQTGELSKVVNTDEINTITVRSWMAKAPHRKSTLVFCVDLAHVTALTRKFRDYGYDARFVTGETPKLERGEILDAFKKGEFPVLVNCGVFTEGTDIPNIDCIVLGRPTRSRNLLVQMIGRGMRLHPGKKNCHIIDLVSSLETGIVTTPTLFGLNPDELVDEASVDDMKKRKASLSAMASRLSQNPHALETEVSSDSMNNKNNDKSSTVETRVTFTQYKSVLDLISDTSGERHIRAISQYSWVQIGHERFVLSAPSGSYIRIERIPYNPTEVPNPSSSFPSPSWVALEVRAVSSCSSPFSRPRPILTAATFEHAVHGADSYAANAFPHTFIQRNQPWRYLPATPGQLAFINKIRGKAEPLIASQVTKGKAADMITKIKMGARGRFSKMEAEQRRKAKQSSLVFSRQERERVRVGPLAA